MAEKQGGARNQASHAQDHRGLSWPAMLAWIMLAFVLAALVAWRLVTPFFHRG